MRLDVVGCAGSFAAPHSACSSYLLSAEDRDGRTWRVVVDLGSGAFGPLQDVVDPFDIDAVAISHMHPDHAADLAALQVYRSYHPTGGRLIPGCPSRGGGDLPVWGPSDVVERHAAFTGEASGVSETGFHFSIWQPGVAITVGPLRIEPFVARHPVPAVALRITGPRDDDPEQEVTLCYTGDTDTCRTVTDAARGADILLAEAAFVDGRDDGISGLHLTGTRAGELARDAAVGRLLLTHVPAWNDPDIGVHEARVVYDGPTAAVAAGDSYRW